MKVLFIYRNPAMGFSIGKVFHPIELELKKYAEVDSVCLPVPNYKPIGLWRNIMAARKAVKAKHYDIVHITGAEHYLIPFLRGQKVVVTVHDLGFFTNNKFTLRSAWKWCLWIKTLPLASRVTFISDKSKAEVERLTKFKAGQAVTVLNPVGREFCYEPKAINREFPVILHLGTKPNKNLNNTIIALRDFKCKFRIIGDLDKNTETLLKLYHIDYSVAKDITDQQVLEEYKKCDIVNFPSFYEGFGMPIIEGQAVGRLVITSNLSPMKDVAAGGAVIVDPTSMESIKDGYIEGIANSEKYIEAGLENVKHFDVGKITKEFYNIYKNI